MGFYWDKGYSGKNTDRPQLQRLLRDIEQGKISKVIVYKLDRISRSILDFSNMMEMFQKYNVEFVSSTEKFDTSTPMGRAMLNICIVFAQLERETIQKRVSDAYYSRSQRGFRMGGKPPYGYRLEPYVMQGIHTKKLVVCEEEAVHVKEMYEMYARPDTSYGDVTRFFTESGVTFYGKELIRPTLAQMLRNPVYVRADQDVYRFFKNHGTIITNDPSEFAGTNGCYLYQGRDIKEDKLHHLQGQMLVLAPHEGLIASDVWISCRIKMMNNICIPAKRKAVNTWLAGKIKCAECGYALMSVKNRYGRQYLRCSKRLNNKGCPGCGKIYTADLEDYVYRKMVEKIREFQRPLGYSKAHQHPKIMELSESLDKVEEEISRVLTSLAGASDILVSYVDMKVAELDRRRQEIVDEITRLGTETASPERLDQIVSHLGNWEKASFEEKRMVLDGLVTIIRASENHTEIRWKI